MREPPPYIIERGLLYSGCCAHGNGAGLAILLRILRQSLAAPLLLLLGPAGTLRSLRMLLLLLLLLLQLLLLLLSQISSCNPMRR